MSVTTKTFTLLGCVLNKNYKTLRNVRVLHHVKAFTTSPCLDADVPFVLSDIGEGIREVVVKEWFVKEGDKVLQFDNICEVQSDKASVTITSRYDGVITKLHYNVDDTALVGKPLINIETDAEETVAEIPAETTTSTSAESKPVTVPIETSIAMLSGLCIPSVRRLAKEHSIDLSKVMGTGKQGRILKEDVLKFLGHVETTTNSSNILTSNVQTRDKSDRIEVVKGFQKAMVKTMTESLKIPHFVYSDEIVVTKLYQMRMSIKTECDALGIKISAMPFFIKAASNSLSHFPILNASIDESCENITYKGSHNIGIAMDTKVGLAVPVIKNVQDLSIVQIAQELSRLMVSGKNGTFSASDLTNGSFSISNIGAIGGTYVKPVILPPQVAIIAIGASQRLPRFDQSMNVIAEDIVKLSGAADHRVVDGATMAKFVNHFKRQIENPHFLFLDL